MKGHNELGIYRLRDIYSEGVLPAGNPAAAGSAGGQSVAPVTVNFGRPGRRVGAGTLRGRAMDSGLLGMERRRVYLIRRLLGTSGRLLWRY